MFSPDAIREHVDSFLERAGAEEATQFFARELALTLDDGSMVSYDPEPGVLVLHESLVDPVGVRCYSAAWR